VRDDAWLTQRLGRPAFVVEPGDDAGALPGGAGFFHAKVPASDVARVGALEACGFRVVDLNLTLRREPSPLPAPALPVVEAGPEHRDAVLDIAVREQRSSRFHLDPAIPDDAAAAIKRDWAAAVLDGERGERMLVALDGDAVVGYIAAAAGGDAAVIDLIAVRAGHRSGGAGASLVAAVAEGGARAVEVGTQAANVGALRFYERLGFRAIASRYVLHLHRG
jgi:dTDP-4-amino-4,6-dideoxy-D-galactose acyltransferase